MAAPKYEYMYAVPMEAGVYASTLTRAGSVDNTCMRPDRIGRAENVHAAESTGDGAGQPHSEVPSVGVANIRGAAETAEYV